MLSTVKKTSPTLLPISLLRPAQHDAIDRLYNYDSTLLLGKMGSGKTLLALTAASELLHEHLLNRVLIIGTKKVCETVWPHEAGKWEHLSKFGYETRAALGTPKQRRAAIDAGTAFVCINFENVPWFFDTYGNNHNFDGIIIDETSKLKNPDGTTFKRLRHRLKNFVWRVGLTGTPVSEDFLGMYGQALLLDDGDALGTNYQDFKDDYFIPVDYEQRNWQLRAMGAAGITSRLVELVYTLPDYRDTLPPISYETKTVTLPDNAREVYKTMAREMLVEIEGETIASVNTGVMTLRLQQITQGFLYPPPDSDAHTIRLHITKLKALSDLICDARRGPVIVAYWFQEELELLQEYFPQGVAMMSAKTQEVVDAWNAREIPILFLHPRSAGHGLNLAQGGCEIIWYTPYWSRDLWEQTNARLWRTGQKEAVKVTVIEAENTIDQVIAKRIEDKGAHDYLFHAHLLDAAR